MLCDTHIPFEVNGDIWGTPKNKRENRQKNDASRPQNMRCCCRWRQRDSSVVLDEICFVVWCVGGEELFANPAGLM